MSFRAPQPLREVGDRLVVAAVTLAVAVDNGIRYQLATSQVQVGHHKGFDYYVLSLYRHLERQISGL